MKNYVQSFIQLNEASELIKMGVPKEMAKIIHTMAGGQLTTQPFTLQSGKTIDRGVDYEETPVSHDVKISKTIEKSKSYDNSILDYLDSLPSGKRCNILLVSPDKTFMHYIMYKSTSVQHATKGNQYRVVTIDKSTGKAISKWAGTNGQLAGTVPIGTKLYIFEKESRAAEKKEKREKLKNYTDEEFIDYIINNYSNVIKSAFGKYKKTAEKKFYKKLTGLSIEDIYNTLQKSIENRGDDNEYVEIKGTSHYPDDDEIKKYKDNWKNVGDLLDLATAVKRDIVDKEQLTNELNDFKDYMFKNGSYKEEEREGSERADLNDVISSDSLIGTCTKFLQFVTYGKAFTAKNLYNQFFI